MQDYISRACKTLLIIIISVAAICVVHYAGIENRAKPKLVKVTAYCPCSHCCGKWADGYTANGHKIQPGDKFAAAPKHIPFGTILDIPEYGVVPVWDRGGAITVSRLDVFFPTHQEALVWGVKYLVVTRNDRPQRTN